MKSEKIFIVELTYRNKTDPTTGTLLISGRSYFAGQLYSGSSDIYGGLLDINGLGLGMGEVISNDRSGSIIISGTRGNYQFDKRFYDLLEKNTFVEQSFKVYRFEKQPNIIGVSSDLVQIVSGEISNAFIKAESEELEFDVRVDTLLLENPHTELKIEDRPNASPQALGRYPFIFGASVEVPAFYTGPDTIGASFVYSSYFDNFKLGNIETVLCKDKTGKFANVSPNVTSGDNWEGGGVGVSLINTAPCFPRNGSNDSRSAIQKVLGKSGGRIVYNLGYFLVNNGGVSGTVNVDAVCEIHKASDDQIPSVQTLVAKGIARISQVIAPNNFALVNIGLESPAVIEGGVPYYIVFSSIDVASTIFTTGIPFAASGGSSEIFTQYGNDVNFERISAPFSNALYWYATGVNFYTEQNNNLVALKIDDSQGLSPPPNNVTDYSSLEIVIRTQGLIDDSSGTITGTPLNQIGNGRSVARFFWHMMNGSLTGLDDSTFNPFPLIGEVEGATDPANNYRDIFQNILSEKAAKLIPRQNGDLALWAYPRQSQVRATLTENDFTLEDIEILGEDSITNSVSVRYDRRAIPLPEIANQRERSNFAKNLTHENSESIGIYGKKELNTNFLNLNFVQDLNEALRFSGFVLKWSSDERKIIRGHVSYWKDNYREIELYDIIWIVHTGLPSESGSMSSNIEKPLSTDGVDVGGDYSRGFLWRRAKGIFCRVLKIDLDFKIDKEETLLRLEMIQIEDESEISSFMEAIDSA